MRQPSPSDRTDGQWDVVTPLIPSSSVGRPRQVARREVLNTIFSQNRSGGPWDRRPHDLLPKSTVSDSFAQGRDEGPGQEIRDAGRRQVRVAAGREPSPSAGRIDSPTVKTSEVAEERGDDGGQKITGRKRHLLVDTLGVLLVVVVTAAAADDGTVAPEVLGRLTPEHRTRREVVGADGTYHNHHRDAWREGAKVRYRIEVGKRLPGSEGFVKWPGRGLVERTFAGRGRYRRHSRDDERFAESSEAMIKMSSIHRRLRLLKPDLSKEPVSFKYRESQGIIPG